MSSLKNTNLPVWDLNNVLVSNHPLPTWIMDPRDFRILAVSKAATALYQYDEKEFLSLSFLDLFTGEDRASFFHRITKNEPDFHATCHHRSKVGEQLIVDVYVTILSLEGQRRYQVSAIDITERKEAESRLRESESRFREMADSSPAMIWMTDENNRTVYVNREWISFTGMDITKYPDGWSSLIHKEDLEITTKEYYGAFDARQQVSMTYRLRYRNGRYRWVQDLGVPRFLQDGTFIGYIGSLVDIEEEKQKQEKLLYQATILENVTDIVVTTDLEFKVKVWNKIAEQYYGIHRQEAMGKHFRDLVNFNTYGISKEEARAELEQNGMWQGEVSIMDKKGRTAYFFQTFKYVCDAQGNRMGLLGLGRDITGRKIAEEQLARSEQFYRTLIADSLDGMLLLDAGGKITFSSPAVKNLLGYDPEDVLGKNAFDFVHPEDTRWALDSFQKEVQENPEVKFIVIRLLRKNGEWLWCMVRGHNLLNKPYVNSIVVYFHDDTLRRKASEALKESEKQFRNLIRDLQIGIILQDKKGRVLLCNNAFAQIFAARSEDVVGKEIEYVAIDPVHEDGTRYTPEERPTYRAIHTKRLAKDVVMGIRRPGVDHRIWILINADPVLDANGELLHVICSVKDITDRKKMEEDQMARQIFHQKQLTQASIDGQEKERREIGKELHDNIGQQLTTIKLFLDILKSTSDNGNSEMLDMALKGVSDIINEVRAMSRSLVPPTLKDLGLIESLQELIDSLKRTQLLEVWFDHFQFDEDELEENQKLTLFRIVQEQLNNIVKHAEAAHVWIELTTLEHHLEMKIRDDGHGFDPKKVRKGLGFINIQNRAELLDGQAEIISNPGDGCLLKVSMPLTQSALRLINVPVN